MLYISNGHKPALMIDNNNHKGKADISMNKVHIIIMLFVYHNMENNENNSQKETLL